MTLRDVHDRCITCGRTPTEECCDTCHRVHRALWQQVVDGDKRGKSLALGVLSRIDEGNTEAVNQ